MEQSERNAWVRCVHTEHTDTPVGRISITRAEDAYGNNREIRRVQLDGVPLRELPHTTARQIFTNEIIVVKVDIEIANQSSTQAKLWEAFTPLHRTFFSTLLAFGPGFTVERFVKLNKSRNLIPTALLTRAERKYIRLGKQYDIADLQHGTMGQWGLDPKGKLVIHDYGFTNHGERYSVYWPVFTTVPPHDPIPEEIEKLRARRANITQYGVGSLEVISPGVYRLAKTPSPPKMPTRRVSKRQTLLNLMGVTSA